MPIQTTHIPDDAVSIDDMRDGDLAKIVNYPLCPQDAGHIVQRFNQTLIYIGEPYAQARSGLFSCKHTDLFVRILPKGTTLIIS